MQSPETNTRVLILPQKELEERAVMLFGKKNWNKLDTQARSEIIENLNEKYKDESKDTESVLNEVRLYRRNQVNIIIPLILGLFGGMTGNILDRFFIHFGYVYALIGVLLFVLIFITFLRSYGSTVKEILLFSPRFRRFFTKDKGVDK